MNRGEQRGQGAEPRRQMRPEPGYFVEQVHPSHICRNTQVVAISFQARSSASPNDIMNHRRIRVRSWPAIMLAACLCTSSRVAADCTNTGILPINDLGSGL